ncbi:MAG: hypothetical protein AAF828_06835, partial [Bacteroidota bacterium]
MKNYCLLLFALCWLHIGIAAQSCVTTFPYVESFENPNLAGWTAFGFPGWLPNSGATATPNTGPSAASDGVLYYVAEPSRGTGSSVLLSPCFDISGLPQARLTFDYHMFGSQVGRLFVQLSGDGGSTWTGTALLKNGSLGNQWNSATVSLNQFSNTTTLRVRFIASVSNFNGNDGDIAIDNIRVEEVPPCFDISVALQAESCPAAGNGTATLLVYPTTITGLDISWSTGATNVNTISNLSAGNYSVTVTDNQNCTKVKNFTLGAPAAISGELYITPATAGNADGRIFLIPNGGTPPYSVQWLDGTVGTTYGFKAAGYTEVNIQDA